MDIVREWYRRTLSNPQVVILTLLLVVGFLTVLWFSDILAPLFIAVAVAYLLEGLVRQIMRTGMPRIAAVLLVFAAFLLFMFAIAFGLVPKLSRQLTGLFQELPAMLARAEALVLELPTRYPNLFTESQVLAWVDGVKHEATLFGQELLARTVNSFVGILTVIVYVILVPILVFFIMKDKERILGWVRAHLPRDRALATMVWLDGDRQIGNYIRGKFWEILIIFAICYVTFSFFGLRYNAVLSLLIGLSVLIPWVGAVIVTFPLMLVAYFQWGFGTEWLWIMGAYFIIQGFDANILVPLLYSEVVDLHPIAIIAAVLFFGGVWGLWGVFFSIPLATLVQAVIKAWPSPEVPVVTDVPQ